MLRDLHVHTVFSDGADTPEEMVKSAIAMELSEIGFSDHSYTAFDLSYCMSLKGTEEYYAEISRLKEKYAEDISVLCGIEQDLFAGPADRSRYDYSIGSVHYMLIEGEYVPVDENRDILIDAANRYFSGDVLSLAEIYFETVSRVIDVTGADIIGHFDLISKFNEGDSLFDSSSPRYVAAWRSAADRLLESGKPFEINTGAMARGYRSMPYPAGDIRDYIRANGGSFILSSDSHSAGTICFGFGDFADLPEDAAD